MNAVLYLRVSTCSDKRDDDANRQRKRQEVENSAASSGSSAKPEAGRQIVEHWTSGPESSILNGTR
jgi:hypothetical protein